VIAMQANLKRIVQSCCRFVPAGLLLVVSFVLCSLPGCGRTQKSAKSDREVKPATANAARQADSKEDDEEVRPKSNSALRSGRDLYVQHCAACHGAEGDGQGLAARFLYPKPRDFRSGRFRLVSAKNIVPTADDLHEVLVRGMPGSAMVSWGHLSQDERNKLVEEVLRLYRQGIRGAIVAELKEAEEEIVEVEVDAQVEERTTSGEVVELPKASDGDLAAIARGKALYVKQACNACHGNEGRGDGQQVMVDSEGLSTRPRDFTGGVFKGGHDVASIYRRIVLGMPGTPMPSSSNLTAEQIVDLAHFIRSLSSEETRNAAVLKRERLTARHVSKAPRELDSEVWNRIPATAIKTTPLWWRDDFEPLLQVQAVHDGRELVFRLEWKDATQNSSAVRPDEFEDLAAVQLYRGDAEPFLGMGAQDGALELWQWRGGLAQTGAADQLMDDYPFDADVYRHVAEGKALPDFITARVSGNPLATREHEGHSLIASGAGSTTIRPKASQHVAAAAEWKEGRWTVLLRRPLTVPADDGLSLSAGGDCSAAFALWDGSKRDRGGQKLVTIWQDLHLE
jgi:mono/diheme cytochrome c family protein